MHSKTHNHNRVAVVGLGPVGAILAVHLKEAGCAVAVCDSDKIKINLVRKEGLRLEGKIEKRAMFDSVFAELNEVASFKPDFVVVAVKGYQTPAFVEKALALDFPGALFISAQNGIDVEHILSAAYGESLVLRLVINFAGNLKAPNTVKVTFFNPPNYLSSLDDSKKDEAGLFASWLNQVGLTTDTVSSFEILKRAWEKSILNSSLSALCGIGRLTIKEAMEMPDTVEVIEQVIEEAVEVAHAEKIKFEDEFIRKCLRYLRKAGDHFPSLAVDLINGRPTEIDFMNGKIVEYGKKHYIRTSLNLVFTNLVKAMSQKSASAFMKSLDTSLIGKKLTGGRKARMENGVVITGGDKSADYFLGVDLGSAYTKFVVIDSQGGIAFKTALRTLNRDKIGIGHVARAIRSEFNIAGSCATGYGRKRYADADFVRTEINCAAAGVTFGHPEAKNIIDIGGEDIKVIRCGPGGEVLSFYMNDKCAAGTGSFITEIAEQADIRIDEMSSLAAHSDTQKELNSFCTVFAKTEIMKWFIDGMSVEDIARGVYLSIANRVGKLAIDPALPVYLVGGVIACHPYLRDILASRMKHGPAVVKNPQFMAALGAALMARDHSAAPVGEDTHVRKTELK